MATVEYLGGMDHQHKSNPSGTNYMFHVGVPLEVKIEDAIFYAERAKHSAPWKVNLGIIEKATVAVTEAVQPKPKYKYGGKK